MSFAIYRKYEKPLLAVAVVFTVAVFAFFPSFGSMDDAFGGGDDADDVVGSFTVVSTGKRHDVSRLDHSRARQSLGRMRGASGGDLTDELIWSHLMMLEDARGAGLRIPDLEISQALRESFPDTPLTPDLYQRIWRDFLGFPTPRAFEEAFREQLLVQRWREALQEDARVVDADEVYQRWSVDNELFDLDVLVLADAEPESIADPGDEVLQKYFDDMAEYLRKQRFVDPARYDVALAWLDLSTALEALPAERIALLTPATDEDIQRQFELLKITRFAELEELDDATRELLRQELTVTSLATEAHREWVAQEPKAPEGPLPEDGTAAIVPRTAAEFLAHMAAWGLMTDDPAGTLGPDELEALPDVGSPNLVARLVGTQAGGSRFFRPNGSETLATVLFVEEVVPQVPLGFSEARDEVLTAWRGEPDQAGAAAKTLRKALRDSARVVDEAADIIAPLELAAADEAARLIAESAEELDEAATQAIVDAELERVQFDIESRLAQYEHRAWEDLVVAGLASGGIRERISFDDVPRSWRQLNTAPDIDRTTLEYYVKTNGRVFQLAVDSITDVLRHVTGKQSVIVRVAERGFPAKAAMFADAEGMERARERLSAVRASEFMLELMPDRLMQPRSDENPFGHNLLVVAQPEPDAPIDS